MEYQLATETPLGKTPKKKKIKRKPAAELKPLPVHYPLLISISTLFSVWVLDIWRFYSSFERAEFCLLAAIGVRAGSRTASEAKSHPDGRSGSCYFLSFKSFGFADCGGLFREFQSWFSSSIQSSPKLSKADAAGMKQQRLTTRIGGGDIISSLLLSFTLEYSLRVSDSQNIFARYYQFVQLTAVFHILNVLNV